MYLYVTFYKNFSSQKGSRIVKSERSATRGFELISKAPREPACHFFSSHFYKKRNGHLSHIGFETQAGVVPPGSGNPSVLRVVPDLNGQLPHL